MGAGIMLICGDKTLIMKRAPYKHDRFSGYWNFPGGQGEPNESTYETAVRETFEETSIDSSQYKVINHIDTKIYVMYIALCETEIIPTLDHEHTDWMWIHIDDVLKIKDHLHPKDWKGFKRYINYHT